MIPTLRVFFDCYCRSSLESYTSNNTTQHDTHNKTRVQHDTTRDNTSTKRVQHNATQDNTSTTQHNTSTKQPKICFDLFISLLHARSLVN